jgi:hypothetical protein
VAPAGVPQALQGLNVVDWPKNWSQGTINNYNGLARPTRPSASR